MKDKTRIAVLDLETQNAFSEVEVGRLDLLKVSVAGLYCYWTEKFEVLEEGEGPPVDRVSRHHVVPAFQQMHNGRQRTETGGKGIRIGSVLQ